jgi:hypothetical protein
MDMIIKNMPACLVAYFHMFRRGDEPFDAFFARLSPNFARHFAKHKELRKARKIPTDENKVVTFNPEWESVFRRELPGYAEFEKDFKTSELKWREETD